MNILIFDNYDSFTYNLLHYIEGHAGVNVDVFRNDKIDLKDIEKYEKIVLSPGPGLPKDSGFLLELIRTYAPTKNILGVCLGMQAIAEVYGGELINLAEVYHGVASEIQVLDKDEPLFHGIPEHFVAGRYHSWAVSRRNLPSCLIVTCKDEKNCIMGVRHDTFNLRGVQFHPESIMTPEGKMMITNWIAKI